MMKKTELKGCCRAKKCGAAPFSICLLPLCVVIGSVTTQLKEFERKDYSNLILDMSVDDVKVNKYSIGFISDYAIIKRRILEMKKSQKKKTTGSVLLTAHKKNAMGNGFPRRFFYHFYIKKGQNVSLCEIKTTLMHCCQCDIQEASPVRCDIPEIHDIDQ